MSKQDSSNPLTERTYFILFEQHGTDDESRLKSYRQYTKRSPDVTHSPEETRTPWWWYGYATREERDAADKARQLKFDLATGKVLVRRGRK